MIDSKLIAACGMNCALCLAYQRDKNRCMGCNSNDIPNSCRSCSIKVCDKRKNTSSKQCPDCTDYPCKRLKGLDKRYREKYNMSMIENLEDINSIGMEKFLEKQEKRFKCKKCGSLICVHRNKCFKCDI